VRAEVEKDLPRGSCSHHHDFCPSGSMCIEHFNDQHAKSKEDVIDQLWVTAKRLRNEG